MDAESSTSVPPSLAASPPSSAFDTESDSGIAPTRTLFDDPDGDVILQTADNVDFRVLKAVLRFASPVFRTMFSLPQPTSEDAGSADPTPIVPVSESSTAFDLLLRFCYPVEEPDLTQKDRSVILDVLRAALKYEIKFVVDSACRTIKKRVETSMEDAIAWYAVACHLGLEEESRVAAKACLKGAVRGVVVPELSLMSGMDYVNLLDYHDRAGEVVTELFQQHAFATSTTLEIMLSTKCDCRTTSQKFKTDCELKTVVVDQWWSEWVSMLASAFKCAPLRTDVLSISTLAPHLKSTECNKSKNKIFDNWGKTRKAIIAAIQKDINKIDLKVSWK